MNYGTDRQTGEKTDYDYRIPPVTTPCNLGGVRWWFISAVSKNGLYCGRRVGTLYLPPGGTYFGCRHCYDLSYESRNKARHGRLAYRGRSLVLDRRREKLTEGRTWWTYRGVPTRKARQLHALEARMHPDRQMHLPDLM